MSEHLSAAAQRMGIPESLVRRSAEARAKATGASLDEVLAAWAEGGDVPDQPVAAPVDEPAPTPDVPEDPTPEPTIEAPTSETAPAVVAPTVPATAGTVFTRPPVPETVDPEEALMWEQVTTIKTIGLKERTKVSVPTWLLAVFVLVPVLSVFYIALNAEGAACGVAGQLGVNFEGTLINCDGSAFEPGGGGSGAELTAVFNEGRDAYASCVGCHGAAGGGGVGPAMSGGAVLATFPQCSDQIEWTTLGSDGWRAQRGNTYGAQGTPVAGGMPGFASLDPSVVAAVSLYERVAFGGQTLEEAGADCGFSSSDGDGGGDGLAAVNALIAIGRDFYPQCAACHGEGGGGGVGPAMTGGAVLATFPQCSDHVEWTRLGSAGWLAERGSTYGAQNRPVAGGMPGYTTVDPETVLAVVIYERVQFGQQTPAEAGVDCGVTSSGETAEDDDG